MDSAARRTELLRLQERVQQLEAHLKEVAVAHGISLCKQCRCLTRCSDIGLCYGCTLKSHPGNGMDKVCIRRCNMCGDVLVQELQTRVTFGPIYCSPCDASLKAEKGKATERI